MPRLPPIVLGICISTISWPGLGVECAQHKLLSEPILKLSAADFDPEATGEVLLDIGDDELAPFQETLRNISLQMESVSQKSVGRSHAVQLQRLIGELRLALHALRLDDKAPTSGSRLIWPRVCIMAASLLARAHMLGSNVALSDRDRDNHWLSSLEQQLRIFRHSPNNSGMRERALQDASQLFIFLRQFCPGVELLRKFVAMHRGDLVQSIMLLDDMSRMQFAICAYRCDLELSIRLFDVLIDAGFLDPRAPLKFCPKCWGTMQIALRMLGRHEQAERFFSERLKPHVPWVHSTQLPSSFNLLLATAEPRPFLDHAQHRVAELLIGARTAITAEYMEYEQAVLVRHAVNHFDGYHADSWLATEDHGGWWEYLNLKSPSGSWNDALCRRYFTQTCALLRGLAEVDGRLDPKTLKCEGYCDDSGYTPGMVSFYRLGPQRIVPTHRGGTNERLKCQLMIQAPAKGPHGASITVSGVTKHVGAGEVFCFDDSYEHSVRNGGGETADVARVVFDVSFWHPGLIGSPRVPRPLGSQARPHGRMEPDELPDDLRDIPDPFASDTW